jgi:signal transduction histidine kinase
VTGQLFADAGVPTRGAPGRSDRDEPSGAALRALVRAVRDLASARRLEDVVEVVRHAAREIVDADGATFVLRDNGQCFYVDEYAIEPLWRGQRFPLTACISGWAMLNQQQVMIPDIYVDDRIPHAAYRPTFVQSLAMTPIRTDEPVGSIGTYWADHHEATPAELEVLQALADSTAVAMESVRTFQELEDRVVERTAELSAVNRDLGAFAHVAAHDLKAPLSTIAGYVELLEELDGEALSTTGADALAVVKRQATRMAGLIDSVLSYSTAATTPFDVRPVDLNQAVEHVLADVEDLVASRRAEVRISPLPTVHGIPDLIERVLQNLIVNAINYGHADRPTAVVHAEESDSEVRVHVEDNGRGVAPEEREAIFGMFSRGVSAQAAPGSGIGLAFARRVAARHDGSLTVDEAPGGGARFTLTLPRRYAA